MVTAELGVGLTALVLCLGVGLQAVALGVDEIRCVDAARVGARAAARGDDVSRVRALSQSRSPAGSRVEVTTAGGEAVVEVRGPAPGGALGVLGVVGAAVSRATVPLESTESVGDDVARP